MGSYVAHKDERSGLPTFIWLSPRPNEPAGTDATAVAWGVLGELRTAYRMSASAMSTVQRTTVHDQGHGAVLVKFAQQVDGLEVFLRGVTVALTRDLRPVAASGNFAPIVRRAADDFQRPASDAVAAALQSLIGGSLPPGAITASGQQQQYTQFAVAPVGLGNQRYVQDAPARTKQVLYPGPKGLVPAYYVEVGVRRSDGSDSRMKSFVISAADGAVLFENDLTAESALSYRVWADPAGKFTPHVGPYGDSFLPHPTGKPDYSRPTAPLPSTVVTLQNSPFSKNDPWLMTGAAEADGNNVRAYADIGGEDGFDAGDVQLLPSAPDTFDYTLDPESNSTANDAARRAAITQLFYTLNYMHDTFYDAGWDEKSGNPQKSNYNRGGMENDAINGEAQDFSGKNNANAKTPADGAPPRIQMYLWDNPSSVSVPPPSTLAGQYGAGNAAFGPSVFNLSGNLALVDDGMGASSADGCETPFVNAAAVAGQIAVIDRGNCGFVVKAKNAQLNGAVGVIIVNIAPGAAPGMAGTDPTVTIPALSMTQSDGALFKTELNNGNAVQVTMYRSALLREGSFDNMVVAHEWGHILSNRLVGNANGLSGQQARGMGEGWSDFVALLTLVRPEAAMVAANVDWSGTFAVGTFDLHRQLNAYYYGIRRYPYSTDLSKDPLTFRHIGNDVSLPTMPAPNTANSSPTNSEVHNTGEIWASMLWECYTNMLRDTGRYTFDKAQQTMREYLVAGLKLTPINPTFPEARDALLAAMYARDSKDFTSCANSFAKRKLGNGAVAPNREDTTNSGVVESDKLGPELTLVSYKLDDSARTCDNDGIVDDLETGRLAVVIRNTGTAPLTDATLTVTGDSPYFTFQSGENADFPAALPYQDTTAQVDFLLKGSPFLFTPTLTLTIKSASLAVPKTVTMPVVRRMNYDVATNVSTTDTFGVPSAGWSTSSDTSIQGLPTPWKQVVDEMGAGSFLIPDNGVRSDQYLVSPVLMADAKAGLFISFKHRFSFESDTMLNYDGGVVELSGDNGQTWNDLGSSFIQGGYNGSVSYNADDKPTTCNPLTPTADRPGFVKESPGYPNYSYSTIDLGTAYAGKSVRLRFRAATDSGGGAPGWEIGEVSVTGTTNKPFPKAVPQPAVCANRPPVVTATPVQQRVPGGGTATLQGTVWDPDLDPVTYQWVQTSGPMVLISDPSALNQAFTLPQVTEEMDATFALRASDGKGQSEAVVTVTMYPGTGTDTQNGGCSCREVPAKTRAADLAWTFLLAALAGLYCHRRPRNVPRQVTRIDE